MIGISTVCVSILIFAAGLHFYWGCGGQVGLSASLPQKPDGSLVFKPAAVGAHGVGLALLVASVFILGHAGYVDLPVPKAVSKTVVALLVAAFYIRAFGWFQYVGLFKKIRNTTFGQYDTYLHCPLFIVLALGLSYVLIAVP
jgi:hypothetical protein